MHSSDKKDLRQYRNSAFIEMVVVVVVPPPLHFRLSIFCLANEMKKKTERVRRKEAENAFSEFFFAKDISRRVRNYLQ